MSIREGIRNVCNLPEAGSQAISLNKTQFGRYQTKLLEIIQSYSPDETATQIISPILRSGDICVRKGGGAAAKSINGIDCNYPKGSHYQVFSAD